MSPVQTTLAPSARTTVAMRTPQVIPFAACAVLGLLTVLAPPYQHDGPRLALAAAMLAAVVGSAVALPWERWPRWTHAVPALAFFPVIAVLRDATGGSDSGTAPMVALPIFWLAMYGGRIALYLAGVLTAAVLVLPIVLVGGPDYVSSDWRRAALWVAVAFMVGPAVQELVRRLQRRERDLEVLNDELEAGDRQWARFADHLPDTVVLVADEHLRYQLVGGAGAMRQGAEGWRGLTLHQTSGPDNVAALEPLYRAALAGERSTCELASTLTGDVHQVTVAPFELHGRPAVMVVARDVTLAQQRERDIRTLSTQVERLVDEAPTGVAVTDLGGRVLRVNATMRRLLDLPVDGPEDTTLHDLGLVARGEDPLALSRTAPRQHWSSEVRIPRDGDPLDLEVDVVVLAGGTGEPERLLVHAHDVSERRRFEERLQHLAAHDPLTGLANRRTFDDVLERHLRDGARYGLEGAVLMLDLDRFKVVNDTYGHDVGDRLIVAVATALRTVLRDSDTVARLGGDEFAVLLPRGGHAETEQACRRIVDGVRAHVRTQMPTVGDHVSVSVGGVLLRDPALTAGEVLVTADLTMYDVKDAGRDDYRVCDPLAPDAPRGGGSGTSERIRDALRDEGLVLHAQPVVDLGSRDVVGAELLLRMRDGDRLLLPEHFLAVAERTGLVARVDLWVLRRALALLGDLDARGSALPLTVNVSARSLADPDYLQVVTAAVAAAGPAPGRLVFDVAERDASAHPERVRGFVEQVHALGCHVALDDFGAHVGSLHQLQELAVDQVKLDGTLTRGAGSTADLAVVDAIVTIGAGTGITVVAEQVEDETTAAVLRDHLVGRGQGRHLAAPQPWDLLVGSLGERVSAGRSPARLPGPRGPRAVADHLRR